MARGIPEGFWRHSTTLLCRERRAKKPNCDGRGQVICDPCSPATPDSVSPLGDLFVVFQSRLVSTAALARAHWHGSAAVGRRQLTKILRNATNQWRQTGTEGWQHESTRGQSCGAGPARSKRICDCERGATQRSTTLGVLRRVAASCGVLRRLAAASTSVRNAAPKF